MPVGYIALGSNLGNRGENIAEAIRRLKEKGVAVTKVATIIETKPYGVTDQPDFLNTAARVEFRGDAFALLDTLLAVEKEMGRKRLRHWGERNIDIDLLLFDRQVINSERLTLPHAEMAKRDFVLRPLAEIAGEEVHPVLNTTIKELWENLLRGQENE